MSPYAQCSDLRHISRPKTRKSLPGNLVAYDTSRRSPNSPRRPLCLPHDKVYLHHYRQVPFIFGPKQVGLSCFLCKVSDSILSRRGSQSFANEYQRMRRGGRQATQERCRATMRRAGNERYCCILIVRAHTKHRCDKVFTYLNAHMRAKKVKVVNKC